MTNVVPPSDARRPKIGIAGSFGRGNYGDELYVKNYEYWFSPWAKLFLMSGLPKQTYLSKLKNEYVDMMDTIVLGGGDLLCPYREKIDHDFINKSYLRRPVHVAGIGVERNRQDILPSVLERWARFLTDENIRSISNRDPGSASWIREHIQPKVEVSHHPDMVLALPLPKAVKPEGAPIVGLTTRHIKHEKEYRIMERAAAYLAKKGWKVRHIIGGVGGHGAKDFENSKLLRHEGKEVIYTENLNEISRALGECSLVLSMKLHTTIVSAMYGVPTISVNPVVKAKEFMKSIGCEDLTVSPMNDDLMNILERGIPESPWNNVKPIKENAANYMKKLSQNIWNEYLTKNPGIAGNLPKEVPSPKRRDFF
ncbi:polysaccharide pyruvyl transferase family protein [Paracoccus sp. 1_MG-2023]|uniref:polysaccharide pyruvyl transferase family protein n=1 Tax=unclassified Paracoccus (in: a-proteobacteria) TaxID=2688777 RepID=UPI001C09A363|nr:MULTISPECIES: polysaccharide pyruvyl transferase family protein [unclassified Paracoccus (in: a-proteobacteria)]MBU2958914.1 polysaccharide pyruvyl transferase family protein [Paracoccus sp. C2R09]MDO6669996.1 polysaccharide pyruvyl transferase family protein [Paracoccus sp. 1_MG-2023]